MKQHTHIIAAAFIALASTGYSQDWRFQRALQQKAEARECARQEQIALAILVEQNEAIIAHQQWVEGLVARQEWIERQNAIAIQSQERIERENYWAAVRAYRIKLWCEEHPTSYRAEVWRKEQAQAYQAQQWREEHPSRE